MRVPSIVLACLLALPAAAAELAIPGAGPPTQLVQALGDAFNRRQSAVQVQVPSSTGVSGALEAVRSGRAALARMPRQLTAEEVRSGLAQTRIAREAIVFTTGADVTVGSLTPAQLAAAFSGRVRDWRELGGRPGPIRVFTREETAASLVTLRGRLPEFAALRFAADARLVSLEPEMRELMQRFGWGLGWSSLGNARATPGLRILALDGVAPSDEALRAGTYPLYYEIVLIHKAGPLPETAQAFVDFVATSAGRAVIEALDAVPLRPAPAR
jgi:phosphate transport system substrate-binding protein